MRTVAIIILSLAVAMPLWAQPTGEIPAIFDGVGLEEQLGDRVPQDLVFQNASGETIQFGDLLDGERPVLLSMVYFECPMLCSLLLTELTRTLGEMEWTPGDEFDVITVSFSATEVPDQAATSKARFVDQLGREGAEDGWHFLTGDSTSVNALADAVGFQFKWVEESQEYAHPAALMFLSPDGTITRYLHGMGFPPRDVRKALVEASEGTVGSALDRIILYCYQYDPVENAYVLHAQNLMKLGGILTLLVLVAGLGIFWKREQRQLQPTAG